MDILGHFRNNIFPYLAPDMIDRYEGTHLYKEDSDEEQQSEKELVNNGPVMARGQQGGGRRIGH